MRQGTVRDAWADTARDKAPLETTGVERATSQILVNFPKPPRATFQHPRTLNRIYITLNFSFIFTLRFKERLCLDSSTLSAALNFLQIPLFYAHV